MTKTEDAAITRLANLLNFAKRQGLTLQRTMRAMSAAEVQTLAKYGNDQRIRDALARPANQPQRKRGGR